MMDTLRWASFAIGKWTVGHTSSRYCQMIKQFSNIFATSQTARRSRKKNEKKKHNFTFSDRAHAYAVIFKKIISSADSIDDNERAAQPAENTPNFQDTYISWRIWAEITDVLAFMMCGAHTSAFQNTTVLVPHSFFFFFYLPQMLFWINTVRVRSHFSKRGKFFH